VTRLDVLVVAPYVPYPPWFGGASRVYHLLRALAGMHRVSLLCYGTSADLAGAGPLREACETVQVVPPPRGERWRRLYQARSLLGRPYYYYAFYSRRMARALRDTLERRAFDVVQVEFSQMAYHDLPPGPLRILDAHNVEHLLLDRVGRQESQPVRRFYAELQARKFRPDEIRACRRMDGVLTTSGADRAVLAGEGVDTPIHVAPNGVDVEYFTPPDVPTPMPRLLFTGAINYAPNTDAVLCFCTDILPRIRAVVPEATFAVVGRKPPERVRRLASPSVMVTGTVPDVRPFMRDAAVFVVPLRSGSGTRLKILEALASGCAVVSSSVGCEGLDVTDGQDILVADTPGAFADAVVRCLRDPDLRARLGARGRALVERWYRWETIGQAVSGVYAELLDARQRRAAPVGARPVRHGRYGDAAHPSAEVAP
jgi:glycosyltransferase involved in cell wall biosynthesis